MAAHHWPLGEYILSRQIGNGEFGIVYEAMHPVHGAVALKLILLSGHDADEKVEAERHGAILQQRFSRSHRHLVPEVFEHRQIEPYYAVAMELVHGESLTTRLGRAPLPARQAADIALAIATFLEKAHRFTTDIDGQPETIVHADLKPAHVLLIPDGSIRVLDFGIAKALAARKAVTTNKWGSMQYASPERVESGHVNEHVDFWSLGVMLFEMVAGYRPYRQYENSPSQLESAIRRQEPRTPLPPDVDPGIAAIVHKLLAPQLEFRYGSAAAIVQDLSAFLAGAPTVAGAEARRAAQETVRIVPAGSSGVRSSLSAAALPPAARPVAAPSVSVPTEPLPRPDAGAGALVTPPPLPQTISAAVTPVNGVTRAKRPRALRYAWNAVKVIAALMVISTFAGEAVGMARASRFVETVPALDVSDITTARRTYASLRDSGMFGFGARRVRGPLRDRMVELADRTIHEYRSEEPSLARADWEQALECLTLAREVSPNDARVQAKWNYVRGRLTWIRATNRRGWNDAIRMLQESASQDSSSPDPYLGLATIYAYSTHDLDGLTKAIADAERRGYRSGRRERAELGDLHKWLADRARARARPLAGDEREEQLRAAADGYEKCIEYFDGLHMGGSDDSLSDCRSSLRAVNGERDRFSIGDVVEPLLEKIFPPDVEN
jgi:hypothetical protein